MGHPSGLYSTVHAPRYVNLARNPERYTGYTGYTATRIWDAIYEENCFKESGDSQCFEERVFFRLISGLHTSIHSQLAAHFYPDGAPVRQPLPIPHVYPGCP